MHCKCAVYVVKFCTLGMLFTVSKTLPEQHCLQSASVDARAKEKVMQDCRSELSRQQGLSSNVDQVQPWDQALKTMLFAQ